MRNLVCVLILAVVSAGMLLASDPPKAVISNHAIKAEIYLPDEKNGFYRGTRFDWSGVIANLEYAGHNYYGPWFTKTDPSVIDFVYRGDDIVAGPCSAITGPVEEFTWESKALGYDEAEPGGLFLKIGVGMLRRPDSQKYTPYRLYEIANGGKWTVHAASDQVEFTQELSDSETGYGYRYTKTIRLVGDEPEMLIEHTLTNTGHRQIQTSVYDHNFLVLDHQSPGPDFTIKVPFNLEVGNRLNPKLATASGKTFTYRKVLESHETVATPFKGFGPTAADYQIEIENKKLRAGMKIIGNRPLSKESLWSIRSTLAVEPFIDMTIDPGHSFTWHYVYDYYSDRK